MAFDLLASLDGKWDERTRPKAVYASHVEKAPARWVPVLLTGLSSSSKRVQNGCAELCSLLSADHPELLYRHADVFAARLAAKEPVLRWEAACTLGNLAAVDSDGRLTAHVDALVRQLGHPSIVLQGHSAAALCKLVAAHPSLSERICEALLAAQRHFPARRIGVLVESMETFTHDEGLTGRVESFLARQAASKEPSVVRKANKALRALAKAQGLAKPRRAAS